MPRWAKILIGVAAGFVVLAVTIPVVAIAVARTSASHVSSPTARITDQLSGGSHDITIGGGGTAGQTTQHSANAGRQYWTVMVQETNVSSGAASMANPVIMVAIPVKDTTVTQPGTTGWLNPPTAGQFA